MTKLEKSKVEDCYGYSEWIMEHYNKCKKKQKDRTRIEVDENEFALLWATIGILQKNLKLLLENENE